MTSQMISRILNQSLFPKFHPSFLVSSDGPGVPSFQTITPRRMTLTSHTLSFLYPRHVWGVFHRFVSSPFLPQLWAVSFCEMAAARLQAALLCHAGANSLSNSKPPRCSTRNASTGWSCSPVANSSWKMFNARFRLLSMVSAVMSAPCKILANQVFQRA